MKPAKPKTPPKNHKTHTRDGSRETESKDSKPESKKSCLAEQKIQDRVKRVFWVIGLCTLGLAGIMFFNVFGDDIFGNDFGERLPVPIMFGLWIALFLLGIALILYTNKSGFKKPLKVFLLLTGYSAVGFPVFVVLHNIMYALETVTTDIKAINLFAQVLGVTAFLLAVPGSQIGLLVGEIGTIINLRRRDKSKKG